MWHALRDFIDKHWYLIELVVSEREIAQTSSIREIVGPERRGQQTVETQIQSLQRVQVAAPSALECLDAIGPGHDGACQSKGMKLVTNYCSDRNLSLVSLLNAAGTVVIRLKLQKQKQTNIKKKKHTWR